jgi:hypothetical protein
MILRIIRVLSARLKFSIASYCGLAIAILIGSFLATVSSSQETAATPPLTQTVTPEEARKIAGQAYTFAYPLVLVEMTRRANTQDSSPQFLNHFLHALAFPDEHFRQVIRPNADTLYSSAWLDLSAAPALLHVPDTKGRYYVMQFMDAWTETIASPGKRTTGTAEGWFAIVGPNWKGKLPATVQRIDCPTNIAWLIGRTQTNGPSDYEFVHSIQQGYELMPLSAYPKASPPISMADLSQLQLRGSVPPPVQVAGMSTAEFFQLFAHLLAKNPARPADQPMMAQLAKIGIVSGQPFPPPNLAREQLQAIDEGAQASAKALAAFDRSSLPRGKTGWTLPGKYGRYGTNYVVRALTARYFLGILPAEDAVYLSSVRDQSGQPLDGSKRYTMHFEKGATPPERAFWSLTAYDDQGYFAGNPLHRFAIGDRDQLKFNADGSLDIYVQHDSPGTDKESNWLPAPAGSFNLALRIYWPEPAAISGEWTPPPVVPASSGK